MESYGTIKKLGVEWFIASSREAEVQPLRTVMGGVAAGRTVLGSKKLISPGCEDLTEIVGHMILYDTDRTGHIFFRSRRERAPERLTCVDLG